MFLPDRSIWALLGSTGRVLTKCSRFRRACCSFLPSPVLCLGSVLLWTHGSAPEIPIFHQEQIPQTSFFIVICKLLPKGPTSLASGWSSCLHVVPPVPSVFSEDTGNCILKCRPQMCSNLTAIVFLYGSLGRLLFTAQPLVPTVMNDSDQTYWTLPRGLDSGMVYSTKAWFPR